MKDFEGAYKKHFDSEEAKDAYKAELQKLIDDKAQEIKAAKDSFEQENLIREVLLLYKIKEANYGLGLTNRLGLNIIKSQLNAISNANRLYQKGMNKKDIKKFTHIKV